MLARRGGLQSPLGIVLARAFFGFSNHDGPFHKVVVDPAVENLKHLVSEFFVIDVRIDFDEFDRCFYRVIRCIRAAAPGTTIEVLTPDFLRKDGALELVVEAKPDVYNHNLETVPKLYTAVRPGARYYHSLRLLDRVKQLDPAMFTKSGLMVGLGEEKPEVLQVMDDLRSANVDFLTIGQYLQPTPKHYPLDRFITPAEFDDYKSLAIAKGFLLVSATPLTRSSYHADRDFEALRDARENLLAKGRG